MPESSSSDLETERLRRAERAPYAPGDTAAKLPMHLLIPPDKTSRQSDGSRLPIPCSTT